ncbi:MAG TPA: rod shape-determining protein MreC [Candidatus Binatia bacterium]|nr:rod shape-determining protein MreC [Candidatus Binatia bacterium]
MLAFLRKNQIPFSSCFCLLLSFYILTVSARGQLKYEPVGAVLMWVLRPLQMAAQGTANWVVGIQENYLTMSGFKAENERLRRRIQELEVERHRLLEADAVNRKLQQLLEFRSQLPSKAVTASIIANSASSWFQGCILDKGSADGVQKNMAVVTPLGVVGKVVSVTKRSAKVILLTDANSGIDVLVQRTRSRGIVSGSLDNGTVLKYMKRSEDVQVGDRLITSGVDGVFPKGLLVGTVIKVNKQHLGLFQSVEVLPAVQSSRVEEVLVVGGPESAAENN